MESGYGFDRSNGFITIAKEDGTTERVYIIKENQDFLTVSSDGIHTKDVHLIASDSSEASSSESGSSSSYSSNTSSTSNHGSSGSKKAHIKLSTFLKVCIGLVIFDIVCFLIIAIAILIRLYF